MNTITISTIWIPVICVAFLSGWIVAYIQSRKVSRLRNRLRDMKIHIKSVLKYKDVV